MRLFSVYHNIGAKVLDPIHVDYIFLVSCDVNQLRERYKTLSRMIQDAQKYKFPSPNRYYEIEILLNFSCETSSNTPAPTSFLSGSGETDFIDLTLKY